MATVQEEHLLSLAPPQRRVVDAFHDVYYNARYSNLTWGATYWLGAKVLKCPLDLWLYQEMLHETRPDLIIETGTAFGGSALYLASICDLLKQGRVVTIDVDPSPARPAHPRITYITSSSTSLAVERQIRSLAATAARVLVILDSDHSRQHVLRELQIYSQFVTAGSYLVVEDTNVNGHPVRPDFGPGPLEAVDEFLAARHDFVVDRSKEKFLLSFNVNGYLKKVR